MDAKEAIGQYRDYVAKNPAERENARRSFYDTFGKDPESFSQPKSAFQKQATANKLSIETETNRAKEDQTIRDIHGKMAGIVAGAIPMALAAPFTGGASLAPALGMAAGVGAVASIADMGAKAIAGSSDIPMTAGQFAKTLAWDSSISLAGEGTGRVVTKILADSLPAVLKRTASATGDGKAALTDLYATLKGNFREHIASAGGKEVDVARDILDVNNKLRALPLGAQGWSPALKNELPNIVKDLKSDPASGFVSAKQGIEMLVEKKGIVNQVAHGEGVTPDEGKILGEFAGRLDAKIREGIAALPDDKKEYARHLYEASNKVMKVQRENDLAVGLVEKALSSGKGILGRAAAGAAFGGAAGGAAGGASGAKTGAEIGAAAAVGLPIAAQWGVKAIAAHPQGLYELRKAVEYAAQGKTVLAEAAARRAVGVAGIREMIKETYGAKIHPERGLPTEQGQ